MTVEDVIEILNNQAGRADAAEVVRALAERAASVDVVEAAGKFSADQVAHLARQRNKARAEVQRLSSSLLAVKEHLCSVLTWGREALENEIGDPDFAPAGAEMALGFLLGFCAGATDDGDEG